jgi:hypothetical protein
VLNLVILVPQIEALALTEALRQAQRGQLAWTGKLAREHNRHWLAKNAPEILAKNPEVVEAGHCECGGVCLVPAATPEGLLYVCPVIMPTS